MKTETEAIRRVLFETHPSLTSIAGSFDGAFELLLRCYRDSGKLLVCGNGGSAADADHIVGELVKGFRLARELSRAERDALDGSLPKAASPVASRLQKSLPAISLCAHTALVTAIANDTSFDLVFAQQVYGLGRPGDVLLAISSSGDAPNVCRAVEVAEAVGMKTIGLTGGKGGLLATACTLPLVVPGEMTHTVQELHQAIYHALCAMIEFEMFG